jgi:hypothetical protein
MLLVLVLHLVHGPLDVIGRERDVRKEINARVSLLNLKLIKIIEFGSMCTRGSADGIC